MTERKKNRLENYDYSKSGYYFVTTCVKNREEILGKIENGKMILNSYGKIVQNRWEWLGEQYEYVEIDEFVVMPDHFHGILIIHSDDVGTGLDLSSRGIELFPRGIDLSSGISTKNKSLSQLMGAFKTLSSRDIRKNSLEDFQWQRSFYDHIIRNEKSFNLIREYIKNNPLKWEIEKDKHHLPKKS